MRERAAAEGYRRHFFRWTAALLATAQLRTQISSRFTALLLLAVAKRFNTIVSQPIPCSWERSCLLFPPPAAAAGWPRGRRSAPQEVMRSMCPAAAVLLTLTQHWALSTKHYVEVLRVFPLSHSYNLTISSGWKHIVCCMKRFLNPFAKFWLLFPNPCLALSVKPKQILFYFIWKYKTLERNINIYQ